MQEVVKYIEEQKGGAKNPIARVLNSDPHPSWVKTHPFIKGYKYIPIEIQRSILDLLFERWDVEIVSFEQVLNSCVVHVRMRFYSDGKIVRVIDGIGADGLQTDKGSSALDFSKLKAASLQMAMPKARVYAEKNALNDLGVIFGSSLNKDEFGNVLDAALDLQERGLSVTDAVSASETVADLMDLYQSLSKDERMLYQSAFTAKKGVLK